MNSTATLNRPVDALGLLDCSFVPFGMESAIGAQVGLENWTPDGNGGYRVFVNEIAVGTCGKCGGPVVTPALWVTSNINDPAPRYCKDCGANPKPELPQKWGPLLEMK